MSLISTSQITIVDLDDGRTQYTHLAWCNLVLKVNQDGSNAYPAFTKDPEEGRILTHIGIYQDFNFAGSDRPEDYHWSRWHGADGANGLPGKPGADGRTPYIHFAYADSVDGYTGFTTAEVYTPAQDIDSEPTKVKVDVSKKLYMGTYTDYTEEDSNDPARYHWQKVRGADGANGTPGKPGADGRTPYVHFAYANSADGRSDFSLANSSGKKYIGTYTDFEVGDSSDPGRYKWVSLNGDLVIGGRNLWINSKATGYAAIEKLPENHITGQTECFRIEAEEGKNNLRFNLAPEFTSRFYTTLAMSCWVKYENVQRGKYPWSNFNIFKSGGLWRRNSKTGQISSTDYPGMFGFTGSSDWTRLEKVYNFGWDTRYDQLKTDIRILLEGVKTGTAWITGIKIEFGNTTTDYTVAPEDVDSAIASKADQLLTQDQINQLSERNALLKAELDAKATQEVVDEWINQVHNLMDIEEAGRKDAEQAAIRASERIAELQNKVGELKIVTEFVNTYMSQSEEGIIVGQKDGSSKVLVSTDRISFISGGKEAASISQGVLQIDNGVFVKSLRIGRFVTMQDPSNPDRNITLYVGGA